MAYFPSNEWIGSIQTSQPLYVAGLVDLTMRSRLLLALLRRKGRVKLNDSGYQMNWRVKYSLPPMETHIDGAVVNFGNHNSTRTLGLDWGGYHVKDSMTILQEAMNTGANQLINEYQNKVNNTAQSIKEGFCSELYKNGGAVGREKNIDGLETFLGQGTCAATDRVAAPSDVYGLGATSTVLANQGGFWSSDLTDVNNASIATDWPDGNGSVEYDHVSPKLINYSSSAWGTGATTFEANSWRVTSSMIDWITHTAGTEERPDVVVYPNDMYRAYKNHQETKTRITLPHQEATDLGFPDTLNHEGVMIHKDFDCPAGIGYALNCDQMMIRSLMNQLFYTRGPSEDPHTMWSKLIATGFLGNVEYQPKFFAKTAAYA